MDNSLAKVHPELVQEWSERNLPLTPEMVTYGSNKLMWWKGACGHEWQTSIKARSGGSKCPYCSGLILLQGFNDLGTTHPLLAGEWSNRNLPLTPDMVNAKSRKNVWWRCKECGYEWQSVIHARVKGTVCPVCADRAVLPGYNDLATTDSHLLLEWDYERNKGISPNIMSRQSMQSVWWRCSFGHSWKAKIAERTIKGKGCKVCERDYLTAFPKLAVMFYAGMKRLSVQTEYDKVIGIPIEMYIPDERVAIETTTGTEEIEILKEHLCKKRNIRLLRVTYKVGNDEAEFATKIKKALRSVHIFITSDEVEDTVFIRERFFEWRRKQYKKEDV